jgi:hypothetical protein
MSENFQRLVEPSDRAYPGVSMMLMKCFPQVTKVAALLIVIPFSRSRSYKMKNRGKQKKKTRKEKQRGNTHHVVHFSTDAIFSSHFMHFLDAASVVQDAFSQSSLP